MSSPGEKLPFSDFQCAWRIEVLVCDWNGTLVDDVTRAWRATREVLSRRGLSEPELAGFLDSFQLPLKAFFSRLGVPGLELGEAEIEWNAAVGSQKAVLMPGCSEMIRALDEMGVAVGVLSAAETRGVERESCARGLDGSFAFVVGSASPKREKLSYLAEVYGRNRVAYLGDTEHDIEEALAADVLALGFGGGYRPAEALLAAGAESVVTELRRVPTLISPTCK